MLPPLQETLVEAMVAPAACAQVALGKDPTDALTVREQVSPQVPQRILGQWPLCHLCRLHQDTHLSGRCSLSPALCTRGRDSGHCLVSSS